jgi:Mg2+/citrate symporter
VPDRTDSALGIGITAFLFAVIFSMFFSTYLELFPMDAYFWLLLGITAATAREYGIVPGRRATDVSAAPAAAAGAAP